VDFDLSEEQRLLRESLARLLADRYGFEQRKAYAREPDGWSRAMWAAYAELGLLGLPFAEDEGGFGGGAVETMLVAEALGEALALEPWLATVVLGGGALRHGASRQRRAELVPAIAQGSLLLALAHTEAQSRWDLHDVATTAKRDGEGWVLEGRKLVVLHGDVADKLVVTARTAGDRRDRTGIGVFLVDAAASGLTRRGHRTNDGRRAAEVTLAGVRVAAENVLGDPAEGLPLLERVVHEAIAALAAEAVGVMAAAQKIGAMKLISTSWTMLTAVKVWLYCLASSASERSGPISSPPPYRNTTTRASRYMTRAQRCRTRWPAAVTTRTRMGLAGRSRQSQTPMSCRTPMKPPGRLGSGPHSNGPRRRSRPRPDRAVTREPPSKRARHRL